jgi:hypothetical protein
MSDGDIKNIDEIADLYHCDGLDLREALRAAYDLGANEDSRSVAIEQAIAEEREARAKVCRSVGLELDRRGSYQATSIAKACTEAIRARGSR